MVRHVTRPCPCMTTSIILKITRVIGMLTPHWIAVSCHGAEGPMTTGYHCAIFPFCGGGKKKRQKNMGILWLATTGIPVKKYYWVLCSWQWYYRQFFFAIIEFPGIGPCVSAELWDRHGVNIATRYREIGDERLFRRPIKRDRLSLFRRCSIRKGFL